MVKTRLAGFQKGFREIACERARSSMPGTNEVLSKCQLLPSAPTGLSKHSVDGIVFYMRSDALNICCCYYLQHYRRRLAPTLTIMERLHSGWFHHGPQLQNSPWVLQTILLPQPLEC